jgi:hypothetical protein
MLKSISDLEFYLVVGAATDCDHVQPVSISKNLF